MDFLPEVSILLFLYRGFLPFLVVALILNAWLYFFLHRSDRGAVPLAVVLPAPGGYFWASVIIISAALIKLVLSGVQGCDIMESFSVLLMIDMKRDISCALSNMLWAAHQPLYPFLFAIQPFTVSEFAMRSFSVLAAALTGYLVYRFTSELSGRRDTAYLALIFLNIGELFVFYSTRIEPYALLCLFSTASYYYFWRSFIRGDGSCQWKYQAVIFAALFTHYFAFLVVASHFLTMVWLKHSRKQAANVRMLPFLQQLVFFNFFVILLFPLIFESIFYNSVIFSDPWGNMFYLGREYLATIASGVLKLVLILPWGGVFAWLIVLVLLYFAFQFFKQGDGFWAIFCAAFLTGILFEVAFLLSTGSSIGKYYFNPRHLIWLVPLVVVFYGCGAGYLFSSHKANDKILAVFFVCCILLSSASRFAAMVLPSRVPDYQKAFRYVRENARKGDAVVWPVKWIDGIATFYSFGDDLDEGVAVLRSNTLRGRGHSRVWFIVPSEDYFGVPHLSPGALKECLDSFNRYMALDSVREYNRIKVYLFKQSL